jgi:hypothetical protein
MKTLPAEQKNQLVVYGGASFEDQTLEWQIRTLADEVRDTEGRLQGARSKLSMVSAFMAFKNRELMHFLEMEKARLRKLQGLPPEEMYEPSDPEAILNEKNTPKEPEARKRAPRFIEAELKATYRKICLACHPDRTTDSILREYMPVANDCYAIHDLELLTIILQSVRDYKKNKKNRKKMREFFHDKVTDLKKQVQSHKNALQRVLDSRHFQLVRLYEQGKNEECSKLYEQMLHESISDVKVQIAQFNLSKGYKKSASYSMPAELDKYFKTPEPETIDDLRFS